MNKEILLVRLPRVPNLSQDFYGIGYYEGEGFIFCLITEDLINAKPLRRFPFPKDTNYESSNHFDILGIIKNLPKREISEEP